MQTAFRFELKSISEGTGEFEGIASTYGGNPDSYNDIVDVGAFTRTLSSSKERPLLLEHRDGIGTVQLIDTRAGLIAKGKLSLELQKAKDAYVMLKDRIAKGLSIGYETIKSTYVGDVRHLQEVKLYEVSIVLFPANENTAITDVKSQENYMNEKELELQLGQVLLQLKENRTLAEKQQSAVGSMKTELIEKIQSLQAQADALDVKLADRLGSASSDPTLEQELKENGKLQDWLKSKQGVCNIEISGKHLRELLERKTVIDSTALGSMTSGVIPIDRTPGIVQEARQALRMRNVLTSRPTSLPTIDFVKVNSAPTIASLQLTEGVAKIENAVTFTTSTAYVKTIASWIPMTRQAMDDFAELMGYIRNALPYYVNLREEVEFLHGPGGSMEINGLVTQASALQPALALPAYNKSDLISAAIQQIEIATETEPTFVVLHPTDYWQILRTKDANRNYIFNNNNILVDPFWGLTPIRTTKMGSGNFLVGSGSPVAVEIRDRMGMELAISTEHSTFFTENKIAVRAEQRTTLVVYRPGSFVFGSFTTSP